MIKKIVIIGPESTGKTTLSEELAKHFNAIFCPEYAREYLLQNGIRYNYSDLIRIAQGQLAMEDYCEQVVNEGLSTVSGEWSIAHDALSTGSKLEARSSLLFIDTNMYVMKVWYEYVFNRCEQFVLDQIAQRHYDLYLLCEIDLPWVAQPMREYPDRQQRLELYDMYKDILANQQTPWAEIRGNHKERLQRAVDAVQQYCIQQ
jgi:nicotinamide riboside kinase